MPALALTVSSELQPWCPDFFCFPPPCSWTHLYERSESQPMIRRRERRATREGLISHRWESSWFSSCPAPRRLEVCPVRFHHQDSRTRGFSCGASWSWSWICLSPVQWGEKLEIKNKFRWLFGNEIKASCSFILLQVSGFPSSTKRKVFARSPKIKRAFYYALNESDMKGNSG